MATEITIDGVPMFDGTYNLDLEQPLNGDELHLIKVAAGVRMGEISEALDAGDYDLIIALATIALWRYGKVEEKNTQNAFAMLRKAEMGKITSRDLDDEADAGPPSQAPSAGGEPNASGANSTSSSVVSLPTGDAPRATVQPPTGTPASATGAG
jgi:hypothetical protein